MHLSIAETATVLGKSERQIRYLIRQGKLPASKDGKSWRIDSDRLPVGDAERLQLEQRLETARQQVETAFTPLAKALDASDSGSTPERYSVRKLAAFETGRDLYRELVTTTGGSHAACPLLFEALVQLTQGCHAFRSEDKARCFGEARRLVAAAIAHLFVGADAGGEALGVRLEQELIPKLGGLVAAQEKGGGRRGSRFERFGTRRGNEG